MTCSNLLTHLLDAGPQIIFLFAVLGGMLFIAWLVTGEDE